MNIHRICSAIIITLAIIKTAQAQSDEQIRSNASFESKAYQSTSAIGQLGEITGQQVQRPTSSGYVQPRPSTIKNYSHYTPPPKKAPPKKVNSNSAMKAFATTMVVFSILNALDNSQQQAQAQWQAEQARILEEQRQQAQRVLTAQRLREAWDNADANLSNSLSSTLSTPGQGTRFFGSTVADPTAIDDMFSAPVIIPSQPPALPFPPATMDPVPQPTNGSGLMSSPPPTLGEARPIPAPDPDVTLNDVRKALLKESLELAKAVIISCLPFKKQIELMADHTEKMTAFTDDILSTALNPRIARTLAKGSFAEHQQLIDEIDEAEGKAMTLGLKVGPINSKGLSLLYRYCKERKVDVDQAREMITDETRKTIVESMADCLSYGK